MMIKPQTLKGFRDFLPRQARKRQYVIETLKKVFESYGFEPLETPALEYEEVLLGKYGEEGDKLMYRFEDLGKRRVALRYDQTVPLARVVAQYGEKLPLPFKRYQIQPVWRAENTQKGRFREFLQVDIDTAGSPSLFADAEIIQCSLEAAKKLGFKNYKMLINDRYIFRNLEPTYITSIDKLRKIGKEEVIKELVSKGMDKKTATNILNWDNELPPNTKNLFRNLEALGLKIVEDFEFDNTLARGLDYYTSSIFELVSPDYKAGSLGGGGRYDRLIGIFAGRDIPAVGFAFGFDRIIEAMDELKLFPDELTTTKVLVTVFSKELKEKSIEVSSRLRSNNISCELYLDENAKMEKQLKYADQKGIPYVVIIGPNEASKNQVTVRNMKTREQKVISQEDLMSLFFERTK